jgi:Uma2 family endonuclease
MGMAISVPRYTIEDLDRFPEDGNRYELLEGLLLVTPGPSNAHQTIAGRIHTRLAVALDLTGHARVVSPGVVVRPPETQLQPDVLVYPRRFSPSTDWVEITENWLAVEVFSRSSRVYDRDFKRDAYLALGVQNVWLVDPAARVVFTSSRHGDSVAVSDLLRWTAPGTGVLITIDLAELFAELD